MKIRLNGKIVTLKKLSVLGWAGRDLAMVQKHIDELKEIGVAPPKSVPVVYHVAPQNANQDAMVDFLGEKHSGECEACLICDDDGKTWISVGSDHTDREFEAISVAHSKQICAKPVADTAWPVEDVLDHWDDLEISSDIQKHVGEPFVPYQSGKLNTLLHYNDIMQKLDALTARDGKLLPNTLVYCGTVPIIGKTYLNAAALRVRLHDPKAGNTIEHTYEMHNLEVSI